MNYSFRAIAKQIQEHRTSNGATRGAAIEQVYEDLMRTGEWERFWRENGRWFLQQVEYRLPQLLAADGTSLIVQSKRGKPWYADKPDSWLDHEARLGGGIQRKPWRDVVRLDLRTSVNVLRRTAGTINYHADMREKIAELIPEGQVLGDVVKELPETLREYLCGEATRHRVPSKRQRQIAAVRS